MEKTNEQKLEDRKLKRREYMRNYKKKEYEMNHERALNRQHMYYYKNTYKSDLDNLHKYGSNFPKVVKIISSCEKLKNEPELLVEVLRDFLKKQELSL